MKRGPIVHHIVMIPMRICTQTEGDKTLAILPAWALQQKIASGIDQESAIDSLCQMVAESWEGRRK